MKQSAMLLLLGVVLVGATNDSNYNILQDPLDYDEDLEIVHLFNNEWPTDIAICSNGRQFSCFTAGFDPANTYDGSNGVFAVAELTDRTTEVAYPDSKINSPPGGAIDYSRSPPVVKGLSEFFLGVSGLYCDTNNDLYVLDAGRAMDRNGVLAPASPGGPKLVVISTSNDTVVRTFVFSETVAPYDSFFSDVTVDSINYHAYVADASGSQRNGIVVIDMSTGKARRVLEGDFSVTASYGFLPFCWGDPNYQVRSDPDGHPIRASFTTYGVFGVGLTNNATTLFYGRAGGRYLFSIPTYLLRDPNVTASEVVFYVRNYGEKGWGFGLTVADDYKVYTANAEQDAVVFYDPELGLVHVFSRDKRINFAYSLDIFDGFLYFIVNQLNYLRGLYPGRGELIQDRRQKPYVLFKKRLPNGASAAVH